MSCTSLETFNAHCAGAQQMQVSVFWNECGYEIVTADSLLRRIPAFMRRIPKIIRSCTAVSQAKTKIMRPAASLKAASTSPSF